MVECHELKKGDIFSCENCGIELQVTKACEDSESKTCGCGPCKFICCDEELKLKK